MRLIVCEDNEAVIKIVQKQRSMAMRHVSRTHRICLDWTFEVMQNPSVSLCYVNTMYQIADMMTKAITKKDVWIVLLSLIAIEAENGGGQHDPSLGGASGNRCNIEKKGAKPVTKEIGKSKNVQQSGVNNQGGEHAMVSCLKGDISYELVMCVAQCAHVSPVALFAQPAFVPAPRRALRHCVAPRAMAQQLARAIAPSMAGPGGTRGSASAGAASSNQTWKPFTSFQVRQIQKAVAFMLGDPNLQLSLKNTSHVSPMKEIEHTLDLFRKFDICGDVVSKFRDNAVPVDGFPIETCNPRNNFVRILSDSTLKTKEKRTAKLKLCGPEQAMQTCFGDKNIEITITSGDKIEGLAEKARHYNVVDRNVGRVRARGNTWPGVDYVDVTLIVFWSCNDIYTEKGTEARRKGPEKMDFLEEDLNKVVDFCNAVAMYPKHIVIGPGTSERWHMSPAFDNYAGQAVEVIKKSGINIISPDQIYRGMTMRDAIHFDDQPHNIEMLTAIAHDAAVIANGTFQLRDGIMSRGRPVALPGETRGLDDDRDMDVQDASDQHQKAVNIAKEAAELDRQATTEHNKVTFDVMRESELGVKAKIDEQERPDDDENQNPVIVRHDPNAYPHRSLLDLYRGEGYWHTLEAKGNRGARYQNHAFSSWVCGLVRGAVSLTRPDGSIDFVKISEQSANKRYRNFPTDPDEMVAMLISQSDKIRFQVFYQRRSGNFYGEGPSGDDKPIGIRAVQGQRFFVSDPRGMPKETLTSKDLKFLYHGTYPQHAENIKRDGLRPGGIAAGERRTDLFFSPRRQAPGETLAGYDESKLPFAVYHTDRPVIFVVSTEVMDDLGIAYCITPSNAVLTDRHVDRCALHSLIDARSGQVLWRGPAHEMQKAYEQKESHVMCDNSVYDNRAGHRETEAETDDMSMTIEYQVVEGGKFFNERLPKKTSPLWPSMTVNEGQNYITNPYTNVRDKYWKVVWIEYIREQYDHNHDERDKKIAQALLMFGVTVKDYIDDSNPAKLRTVAQEYLDFRRAAIEKTNAEEKARQEQGARGNLGPASADLGSSCKAPGLARLPEPKATQSFLDPSAPVIYKKPSPQPPPTLLPAKPKSPTPAKEPPSIDPAYMREIVRADDHDARTCCRKFIRDMEDNLFGPNGDRKPTVSEIIDVSTLVGGFRRMADRTCTVDKENYLVPKNTVFNDHWTDLLRARQNDAMGQEIARHVNNITKIVVARILKDKVKRENNESVSTDDSSDSGNEARDEEIKREDSMLQTKRPGEPEASSSSRNVAPRFVSWEDALTERLLNKGFTVQQVETEILSYRNLKNHYAELPLVFNLRIDYELRRDTFADTPEDTIDMLQAIVGTRSDRFILEKLLAYQELLASYKSWEDANAQIEHGDLKFLYCVICDYDQVEREITRIKKEMIRADQEPPVDDGEVLDVRNMMPVKKCPHCEEYNDVFNTYCRDCDMFLDPDDPKARDEMEKAQDIARQTYNLCYRTVCRGFTSRRSKESQNARKHYRTATIKFKFASIMERWNNDPTYRDNLRKEGQGIETVKLYDILGHPNNRPRPQPLSKAEREWRGYTRTEEFYGGLSYGREAGNMGYRPHRWQDARYGSEGYGRFSSSDDAGRPGSSSKGAKGAGKSAAQRAQQAGRAAHATSSSSSSRQQSRGPPWRNRRGDDDEWW